MEDKVFFVIATYNSQDLIAKCINSIKIHEPDCAIVVIDNCSTDRTLEQLKSYGDISIIENNRNLGFGAANNQGIQLAINEGADYIYLLNHDAYLVEPIVDKLIESLISNPKVGIISPFHLGASEQMLERQFEKFMYQQGVLNKVYSDFAFYQKSSCYEVDFIPAASWFMDVDMVSKVGFFHPLFFHYGEDNNYLQRVKYWNYKIMVTNKLHIVHIGYAGKQTVVYNYEGYHKLSYKAHFLVRFLDVNENFSPEKLIQNIFKDFYTLLLLILKFRLKIVNNLFKIIIWKFKLFFILRAEHGYQKFIPTKDEI